MIEGEWFRWVIGTINALFLAFSGWVAHLILRNKDEIHDLESEIKILKARPHVDPIEYTRAITEMASAITAMTRAIADLRQEIHTLHMAVNAMQKEIQQ